MAEPNLHLKASLIEHFGKQVEAARALGINEHRLSRIIHRRAVPTRSEQRAISWRLQKTISELFD